MPVYLLHPEDVAFPPAERADRTGLLAVGGDLRPARLLRAYAEGIFPWYSEGQPILWHSPNPRFVLRPEELHVPRSLEKVLRRGRFQFRLDTAFSEVIAACANTPRPDQTGTWITSEMEEAYNALHRLGYAHSAEAYAEGQLLGGIYGVSLGAAFFGESMFARAPDASKAALVVLVRQLERWGFTLFDCQQETAHLARFGATPWKRKAFLAALRRAVEVPSRVGKWELGGG